MKTTNRLQKLLPGLLLAAAGLSLLVSGTALAERDEYADLNAPPKTKNTYTSTRHRKQKIPIPILPAGRSPSITTFSSPGGVTRTTHMASILPMPDRRLKIYGLRCTARSTGLT
jgi:hypothetical protein